MSSLFERALNFVTDLREELAAAETRVEELEATNLAQRNEIAGLLAGADADAFVIGNLNAHCRELDAQIKKLSGPGDAR